MLTHTKWRCGAQKYGLHIADIPLHDLATDFLLLAEERQQGLELKDEMEQLTHQLHVSN